MSDEGIGVSIYRNGAGNVVAAVSINGVVKATWHGERDTRAAWAKVKDWVDREAFTGREPLEVIEFAKP